MNKILFIGFIAFQSCTNTNKNLESKVSIFSDTILDLKNREVTIRYHYPSIDSIVLLETNSKIINDSLSKFPEFRILRMSYEKYDSLNFLKLSEGKKQELKYFSILKDTLICDVYFNSDDGYFYFGKIAVNKDKDIILILGAYKYYGNFISIPVYSRLRFKIYMPEKFKINRIYSQWID